MEWIYPILGKQKCLPFYLSGIGIAEPEYHVKREEGLASHQFLYTRSGRGNLRMAAARNLLLTTGKSIAEVGEAVGYDNPTYFGMVFKKYEGITPTDCRKRYGTSLTW